MRQTSHSQAALALLFRPLTEKTAEKRLHLGECLADMASRVLLLGGFGERKVNVVWDSTKPDGQIEKGFDVTRMKQWLKIQCPTTLRDGLRRTYEWYKGCPSEVRMATAI